MLQCETMSALAYKLASDLATAPTLRLLAAGRQDGGSCWILPCPRLARAYHSPLPQPSSGGPDYALTSALPLGLGGRTSGAVQMDGRFWILPSACSFFISAHLALICSTVGGTILGTVISRVFICA